MFFPTSNFSPYIYNRLIEDEKYIFFTGKEMPDHIQINSAFNIYTLTIKTFVNNQWKIIFEKKYKGPVKILAIGNLLRDKRQQLVIGNYSAGSASALRFEVLGWNKGMVEVLLNKLGINDSYSFGNLSIRNNALYVTASTQGEIFIWDGKQFISYPFLNNPDISLIKKSDIIISYEILPEGKIISSIPSNSLLTLKRGQRLFLIRKNLGPLEKVMFSGNIFSFDSNFPSLILEATQLGKGYLTIEPNLYNPDYLIIYQIEVSS